MIDHFELPVILNLTPFCETAIDATYKLFWLFGPNGISRIERF
jgi:hypothetical protein